MERTKLLQEIKMHRFEEAYQGWGGGRLSQEEAALILGVSSRTFRDRKFLVHPAAAGRPWRVGGNPLFALRPGPKKLYFTGFL